MHLQVRDRVALIAVVLAVLGVVPATPCFAANAQTQIFTLGSYVSSGPGPDSMTATSSEEITATGGNAAPDNPEDILLVDGIQGATVTFKGRSANSGCFYTTWGTYVGGGGSGGGDTAKTWEAWFDDNGGGRIVLQINNPGHDDDQVSKLDSSVGSVGGKIVVYLVGTPDNEPHNITLTGNGLYVPGAALPMGQQNGSWVSQMEVSTRATAIGEISVTAADDNGWDSDTADAVGFTAWFEHYGRPVTELKLGKYEQSGLSIGYEKYISGCTIKSVGSIAATLKHPWWVTVTNKEDEDDYGWVVLKNRAGFFVTKVKILSVKRSVVLWLAP